MSACRRLSTAALVKATEYDGVLNVLASARRTQFLGRLLYMTSSGVTIPSAAATLLNSYKGNTLRWRARSEQEIRASGLDYTIIRAGILLNREGRRRAVQITQAALPLSWRYRIAEPTSPTRSWLRSCERFLAAIDRYRREFGTVGR